MRCDNAGRGRVDLFFPINRLNSDSFPVTLTIFGFLFYAMISKRDTATFAWLRGWHDGSRFTKGGENMSIYKFVNWWNPITLLGGGRNVVAEGSRSTWMS